MTETSNKLILTLSDNSDDLSEIFRFLYNSFSINYFEFRGKKHCNRETIWYDPIDSMNEELHKECTKNNKEYEYTEADGFEQGETPFNDPEDIKYTEETGEYQSSSCRFYNEKGKIDYFYKYDQSEMYKGNNETVDKIIEFISSGGNFLDIEFIHEKSLHFINKRGRNYDMRGADDTVVVLPFEQYIEMNNKITMGELLTSLYTIKSHKFDYNYEMYFEIILRHSSHYNRCDFTFDHGS